MPTNTSPNEGMIVSLDVNIQNVLVDKSFIIYEPSFAFEQSRVYNIKLKNDGFQSVVVSDFTYGPGYGVYNWTSASPNGRFLGIDKEIVINCVGSQLNSDKPNKKCLLCPLINGLNCWFCSSYRCLVCPPGYIIDRMNHTCNNPVGACPSSNFVFFEDPVT